MNSHMLVTHPQQFINLWKILIYTPVYFLSSILSWQVNDFLKLMLSPQNKAELLDLGVLIHGIFKS